MNLSLLKTVMQSGLAIVLTSLSAICLAEKAPKTKAPWVTAYYTAWKEASYPPEFIDMRPITHLVYFSLVPGDKGTLDANTNKVNDPCALKLAALAHSKLASALICIGGADTAPQFRKDISADNRAAFVASIVDWVDKHGFDGVDIDMEPVEAKDTPDYQAFIGDLRTAMKSKNRKWLLTAAVGGDTAPFAAIVDDFDQINVMTYDLAGPWEGWETWFNSSLSNGDRKFKSNGEPIPCAASELRSWLTAGVPPSKLGLGMAFYGGVWHGATGPNQPIAGVKFDNLTYQEIMDTYFQPTRYHWDKGPGAPYLSIDDPDPTKRLFISYDDERLCAAKIAYVKQNGLGGAIIWELSGGYRPGLPEGKRNPLLEAIFGAL